MKSKPGFFPMFMDIRAKKILFVGAGKIATRRIKVLSEFDTDITVIATEFSEEVRVLGQAGQINCIQAEIDEKMLGYDIVFACTDDHELNHRIYLECKNAGILVNNCSNHEECDFYFPGIVRKENVVVGVNAGGSAHSKAKEIREQIQQILE